MTAEIAILNRQAIALAADSAITIGKERVWEYANKIFSLGPHCDIGVMIYNSGDFIGVPWEIIIKLFKSSISKDVETVGDVVVEFKRFLHSEAIHNESMEKLSFSLICVDSIEKISKGLNYKTKSEMTSLVQQRVIDALAQMDGVDSFDNAPDFKSFSKEYLSVITGISKESFRFQVDTKTKGLILQLCYAHLTKPINSGYFTGVVFAGFGRNELFPSIEHIIVDGRAGNFTRVWTTNKQNLNEVGENSSYIFSFAQSDIAVLFMEGIAKKYLRFLEVSLKKILDNKSDSLVSDYIGDDDEKKVEMSRQRKDNSVIVDGLMEEFDQYRNRLLVNPLMKAVRSLPKEEMAVIAESLVELTALRRRLDSKLQSVGGPIDVAVISKSDGFIWLKRKHYFNVDANRDFLYRKERQLDGGSDEK